MSAHNSTAPAKPSKPTPDFPLFPHATGRWAKKIKGKTRYFGRWDDPDGALLEYTAFMAGKPFRKPAQSSPDRPAKPYPEFPLFPHATGYWAKKIRGKMYYFGRWDDPDGALEDYEKRKEAIQSGRRPREDPDAVTVWDLVETFLDHKQAKVEAGELSPRTMIDCKATTDLIVAQFDKRRIVADLGPDDFAELRAVMSRKWGFLRVRDFIVRVRGVFKFGLARGMIEKPICFGPEFDPPSVKVIRREKASKGRRDFEAAELLKIIKAAGVPLKAMVLLGVNCGFGNADCGMLPMSAVNLETGWVSFPRPKTGIDRRCPLWPETIEAIRQAIAQRPQPKKAECESLVFLTRTGISWHKQMEDNPISKEMRKLLDGLGINGHRNFYSLRRTFETVGGESIDQVAVDFIMGHAPPPEDMAAVYRQRISDKRLVDVVNHVHKWLWPDNKKTTRRI